MNILELKGISKHFGGVAALSEVDLHVKAGECLALMGGNGAGKSTLVSIVTGTSRPDSGQLHFDGRQVDFSGPHDAREAGVEAVFQHLALCENLDAPGNLLLGREISVGPPGLRLLRRRQMERAATQILEDLGIRIPDLRTSTENYSGGQRQGLAFARAVRANPRFLVLDEPSAALGIEERARVVETLRKLRQEKSVAMLLITHNLTEMRELADRVTVLRHGRVAGSVDLGDADDDDVVAMITGSGTT